VGGVRLPPENSLQVSTIRHTVVCPTCQLSQFERGNGTCRRCNHSLGFTFFELSLSSPAISLDSQRLTAMRMEVGGLIRRLRSRHGITQAALAALTGIHRTYLSRVEQGRVTPSIFTLMQIAAAVGVDKIMLRVRVTST
jgi:DNA-binding XRE family transcriptional regulator